jgi:hypothetical protein
MLAGDEIRKVDVTEDGGFVEYKPLTYGEFISLQKIEDEAERRIEALSLMLIPTNPDLTADKIRNAPSAYIQQIMAAIAADDNRFLLPGLTRLYKSLAVALMREKSGKSATGLRKAPKNSESIV